MSNIIIGIHGLGNKVSPEILESWWKSAINEGLTGIGKEEVEFDFKMIYWADVLYEKPICENSIDEKYTVGVKTPVANPSAIRKIFLDILEMGTDKIFLNDDLTLNYSFLFDSYVHRNFRDLEIYYASNKNNAVKSRKEFKDIVREKVIKVFLKHRNDNIFLVCHSMGSIIAYDALMLLSNKIQIDTLTTFGSPLGQPYVISKAAAEFNKLGYKNKKLIVPEAVENYWYNFSDLDDKVAINYQLADDYLPNKKGTKVTDIIVKNNYEYNGVKNPHKSFGYLRTPEFSNVLYNFIISEKKKTANLFGRLADKLNRFFKRIG